MTLYYVKILQTFLPLAILSGIIHALSGRTELTSSKITWRNTFSSIGGGLLFGALVYVVSIRREIIIEVQTLLSVLNIFLLLALFILSFIQAGKEGIVSAIRWIVSVVMISALTVKGLVVTLIFISNEALSVTSVINTELLLNIGGILLGALAIAAVILLTDHLASNISRGAGLAVFILLCAVLVLLWEAETMLGLMRMEMLAMTSSGLSFVAKVMDLSLYLPYYQIILFGTLAFLFFRSRSKVNEKTLEGIGKAEARKVRNMGLYELKWFRTSIMVMVILFSVLIYYDLYASRPPQISTPVPITADTEGIIKIKVDDVKDGRLHRYSYETSSGQIVRFFLINVYRNSVKIDALFDACILCGGERGYMHKDNDLICLHCSVKIFIPSLGRPGGCNPIPLEHEIKDGYVLITTKALEKGADYF